jgi:hypothetical protein
LGNVEVIATLSTERSYLLGEEKLFRATKIYGGRCRHELIRIDYSKPVQRPGLITPQQHAATASRPAAISS